MWDVLSISTDPIKTVIIQEATVRKDSFPNVLGKWAKKGGAKPN